MDLLRHAEALISPPRLMDITKRACNGCRTRKRKCDGQQPCTSCVKHGKRDEHGNPICLYSTETKKRGPKKGYKETLIQRLETLESILNPLQKSKVASAGDSFVGKWAATTQESIEYQNNPNILVRQKGYLDWDTNTSIPPMLENPKQVVSNEEEFELHLLRLGLQYCTPSTNYRLSLLFGEEYLYHQRAIHQSLRMALCAHGVFYSKHPYLSTLIQKKGNESRIAFVASYLNQAEKMIPKQLQREFDIIDAVRAMLVIVDGYVAIGNREEALRIHGIFSLMQ